MNKTFVQMLEALGYDMGDPSGIELNNGKLFTIFYDTKNHHIAGMINDPSYFILDNSDNKTDCPCYCHADGIMNFVFKIINFFQKLFGINKICACGAVH